jgi:hypothetical protein
MNLCCWAAKNIEEGYWYRNCAVHHVGQCLEGSYSKGEKSMYAKSLGFAIAIILAILLLPSSSYAQSRTATESVADIDTSTHPNGSIVILNKEQTDVPGYVHTQYAFIDQLCGAQLVDHYGPPVDPNDKELKLVEQRACMEIAMNTRDGD